jgi:hypothetical protein
MKTRSWFAAGMFFLLFSVSSAYAQDQLVQPIAKVLPAKGKDVIKLLVADNPGKSVSVKFYNNEGVFGRDEITGPDASGFMRKYNLNQVFDRHFWMQVETQGAIFTYMITKDASGIVAELREATHTYPVLAAR